MSGGGKKPDVNAVNNFIKGLKRAGRTATTGTYFLGLGVGALWLGSKCFYTVEGGHRAILFDRVRGVMDMVVPEGFHFRMPYLQWPIIYDIRAKPTEMSSPTGSKDLQTVNIKLRVLCRPDPKDLPATYRRLGTNYDERVLPSICNEVLKSVVAKFNASQLLVQRQEVSLMIRNQLVDRARDFNLILDDVSITDLQFSTQYSQAVESKQVAQQEAQRAQFLVERAIQERQQKIVQAEGEAAAAKLVGDSMKNNPGYLKLRKLDAARKIARTVAQSHNKIYLNSNSLMLNIADDKYDPTYEHVQ